MTDAGKLFGLNSESGAKNALRILKLPEKIRDLVASREIPERVARSLVPYCSCPAIIKQMVKEFEDDLEGTIYQFTRDDVDPWWLRDLIAKNLRPVSPGAEHNYGWDKGRFGCLFDWQAHESQLQIIELPVREGKKSKQVKFALNVKLCDKLNDPLVQKKIEAQQSKQSKGKGSSSAKSKDRKLTPAEAAAEAKRKAKEQSEQLDRFSREWACRLLRCAIAGRSTDDELVALTLPWLVGRCDQSDLCRHHEQAFIECQIDRPKAARSDSWMRVDTLPFLAKSKAKVFDVQNAFWRLLLWPVSTLISDSAKTKLTPAGTLPDKLLA